MKLTRSQESDAFASAIRNFLEASLPSDVRHRFNELSHMQKDAMLWWQQTLATKNWLVPDWPVEYGGTGWTLEQQYIFHQECQKVGAPRVSPFGPVMVGPVIYTFGSEVQKSRFLPGIRNGTELWCQGYSEPGAGSDLASLQMSAVHDGDEYLVNGQKIWTTQAHWADWIFCLVRTATNSKPQAGISFLLINMKSPGIKIRPITSIDGLHHLNEVFFSDVRVPLSNLVGQENEGWRYAKFLLSNERTSVADSATTRAKLSWLKGMTFRNRRDVELPTDAESFAERIASLEMKLTALEITEARAMHAPRGSIEASRTSLPLKLTGTNIQQEVAELSIDMAGTATSVQQRHKPNVNRSADVSNFELPQRLMESYLFGRASTIYGGTSEIQKDIMAKLILQL